VKVEPTRREHLDALAALNREVQDLHVSLEPGKFRRPAVDEVRTWLGKVLEDARFRILMATDEDRPCGYILLRIAEFPGNVFQAARKYLYVDQIAVRGDRRGRGIGTVLIEAAIRTAAELGLGRIELDVWSANRAARRFFASRGFSTSCERMGLEVRSGETGRGG
jgi:diamine N-acetyltransferase